MPDTPAKPTQAQPIQAPAQPQPVTQPLVAEIRQPVMVQVKAGTDWAAIASFTTATVALGLGLLAHRRNKRISRASIKQEWLDSTIKLSATLISKINMMDTWKKESNYVAPGTADAIDEAASCLMLMFANSHSDMKDLNELVQDAVDATGHPFFNEYLDELKSWIFKQLQDAQLQIDSMY